MTGVQLTIEDAIRQGEACANRVAANNEKLHEGWQELAFTFLKQYAMRTPHFFPWEFVEAFEKGDFVLPHDWRAVGSVYLRAVREGVIARGTTTGRHPKRHGVVVLGWVSLIYKEAA